MLISAGARNHGSHTRLHWVARKW